MSDMPTLPTQRLLEECDSKIWARYEAGQKKYGADTYLEIDTMQHAIDEVLDLINYARFTYVKLRLLQQGLLEKVHADGSVATATGPEMPGKQKPAQCPYTHSHTREWCGYSTCRES